MKWQIIEKRQVEAGRAGHFVVDRVRALVRELEQRHRHVGGDHHVEVDVAPGRHHEGVIVLPLRDMLAPHAQGGMQSADRKGAVIGILDVEFDAKVLLQEVAVHELDTGHRQGRPFEFGGHQRARDQAQRPSYEQQPCAWQHGRK